MQIALREENKPSTTLNLRVRLFTLDLCCRQVVADLVSLYFVAVTVGGAALVAFISLAPMLDSTEIFPGEYVVQSKWFIEIPHRTEPNISQQK